jgi:drug/metabolite transporter (DMT)-like permease
MAGLRGKALVAYLLICTVWGSTYLAIRVGVADLPPALFAGTRFLVAGLILGAAALALGQALPRSRRDWVTLAVSGTLLLVSGNGVVVWAEQYVESGPASVFVASIPLWTAFFDASIPGGSTTITSRLLLGLALGFLGSALLAGATPAELLQTDLRGPVALLLASASWAMATVLMKRRPAATTPYITAAAQMVIGGAVLVTAGLLAGEAARWEFTGRGMAALGYLIVFGSIVGFTAFGYAVKHASATVVGTYAYVNPVVAVLLGWLILDETVTVRTVAAMALILTAVVLIQFAPAQPAKAPATERNESPA